MMCSSRVCNVYNTPEEISFIASEYPKTEKISVDYAILERAENVFTIPCDIGWSDLGTWTSLYDQSDKDHAHNVALIQSGTILITPANNLILSKEFKARRHQGTGGLYYDRHRRLPYDLSQVRRAIHQGIEREVSKQKGFTSFL